jgi:hypothetical protein
MAKTLFVPVNSLEIEGHWNAVYFIENHRFIEITINNSFIIKDYGKCRDGLRSSFKKVRETEDRHLKDSSKQPSFNPTDVVYKQSDIGVFTFKLDETHWRIPNVKDLGCVEIGDIVLTKYTPIRASWVTAHLHQHAVESNCLIIRGLSRPRGFWVCLCLNQNLYSDIFEASSGSVRLPRLNLKTLRETRIPELPEAAKGLADELWNCIDELTANQKSLFQLKQEVEKYITTNRYQYGSPSLSDNEGVLAGGRWFSAEDIQDTLLPRQVALSHIKNELKRNLDWIELSELLAVSSISRSRLSNGENLKILRLSDAGDDLAYSEQSQSKTKNIVSRLYSDPIIAGEVLVSTLVSNPRVIFIDSTPLPKLYATDHWERLQVRETPGAWALLLNSSITREQLRLSAIGTAQQFATLASIRQILLPNPPRALRIEWEQKLISHHKKKRELEELFNDLLQRSQDLFDALISKLDKQANSLSAMQENSEKR